MKRLSEANMQRLRLEEPPTKKRSEKLTSQLTYRNFWTEEMFLGSNWKYQLNIEICSLPDRTDQSLLSTQMGILKTSDRVRVLPTPIDMAEGLEPRAHCGSFALEMVAIDWDWVHQAHLKT